MKVTALLKERNHWSHVHIDWIISSVACSLTSSLSSSTVIAIFFKWSIRIELLWLCLLNTVVPLLSLSDLVAAECENSWGFSGRYPWSVQKAIRRVWQVIFLNPYSSPFSNCIRHWIYVPLVLHDIHYIYILSPQFCIQSIDDFKWRDRLRDDVKHQSEELTTAQGRLRDIQTSLSESQVNEVLNCALTWCWCNTTFPLISSQVTSSFLLPCIFPCQMLLQFLLFINLFRALFTIKKPLLPCCYLHVSCRSWHFVNLFLHYLVSSFLLSPSTGTCAALFSLLFLFYIVLQLVFLFLF